MCVCERKRDREKGNQNEREKRGFRMKEGEREIKNEDQKVKKNINKRTYSPAVGEK